VVILVYFSRFWYVWSWKNLATLISGVIGRKTVIIIFPLIQVFGATARDSSFP
jgi:hypothetical protein